MEIAFIVVLLCFGLMLILNIIMHWCCRRLKVNFECAVKLLREKESLVAALSRRNRKLRRRLEAYKDGEGWKYER